MPHALLALSLIPNMLQGRCRASHFVWVPWLASPAWIHDPSQSISSNQAQSKNLLAWLVGNEFHSFPDGYNTVNISSLALPGATLGQSLLDTDSSQEKQSRGDKEPPSMMTSFAHTHTHTHTPYLILNLYSTDQKHWHNLGTLKNTQPRPPKQEFTSEENCQVTYMHVNIWETLF